MSDEPSNEEIRTVEVRVPVIRVPKLTSGDVVVLPHRQHVAELCDYLADHLYEHRAVLDREQFRRLLDEYARYRLLAAAGVEDYPHVIVEE
jgi:hypothetical protein